MSNIPMQGLAEFLRQTAFNDWYSVSEVDNILRWAGEVEAAQAALSGAVPVAHSLTDLAHKLSYAAYSWGFEAGKFGQHVDTDIAGIKAKAALDALIATAQQHSFHLTEPSDETVPGDETPAEEALRSLACWLGVGGYNAPTVDAKVFETKIREGVTVYSQLHGFASRDLAEAVLHMDLITPRGIRARELARKVLGITKGVRLEIK